MERKRVQSRPYKNASSIKKVRRKKAGRKHLRGSGITRKKKREREGSSREKSDECIGSEAAIGREGKPSTAKVARTGQ